MKKQISTIIIWQHCFAAPKHILVSCIIWFSCFMDVHFLLVVKAMYPFTNHMSQHYIPSIHYTNDGECPLHSSPLHIGTWLLLALHNFWTIGVSVNPSLNTRTARTTLSFNMIMFVLTLYTSCNILLVFQLTTVTVVRTKKLNKNIFKTMLLWVN